MDNNSATLQVIEGYWLVCCAPFTLYYFYQYFLVVYPIIKSLRPQQLGAGARAGAAARAESVAVRPDPHGHVRGADDDETSANVDAATNQLQTILTTTILTLPTATPSPRTSTSTSSTRPLPGRQHVPTALSPAAATSTSTSTSTPATTPAVLGERDHVAAQQRAEAERAVAEQAQSQAEYDIERAERDEEKEEEEHEDLRNIQTQLRLGTEGAHPHPQPRPRHVSPRDGPDDERVLSARTMSIGDILFAPSCVAHFKNALIITSLCIPLQLFALTPCWFRIHDGLACGGTTAASRAILAFNVMSGAHIFSIPTVNYLVKLEQLRELNHIIQVAIHGHSNPISLGDLDAKLCGFAHELKTILANKTQFTNTNKVLFQIHLIQSVALLIATFICGIVLQSTLANPTLIWLGLASLASAWLDGYYLWIGWRFTDRIIKYYKSVQDIVIGTDYFREGTTSINIQKDFWLNTAGDNIYFELPVPCIKIHKGVVLSYIVLILGALAPTVVNIVTGIIQARE